MMNRNRVKTSANDRIRRCADPIFLSQQTDSPAQFLETTPYVHGRGRGMDNTIVHGEGVPHHSQRQTSFMYDQNNNGNIFQSPVNNSATPTRSFSRVATQVPARPVDRGFAKKTDKDGFGSSAPRFGNRIWVRDQNLGLPPKKPRMMDPNARVSPFSGTVHPSKSLVVNEGMDIDTGANCICNRGPTRICCTFCGYMNSEVRLAKTCPVHPNLNFVMDLTLCPACSTSASNIIEI